MVMACQLIENTSFVKFRLGYFKVFKCNIKYSYSTNYNQPAYTSQQPTMYEYTEAVKYASIATQKFNE
ncbi:hypothetical protein SAMN05421882_100743 [Nitrosomonas communis]|uniref:Uncharacterized protein n=1 Tax=Nitrosomonas communis TaxID=44574 RepID=A0A1H2SHX4_9PROT|nr:hypothetical protein SAMN05421882_100743 [Nitrosomonas communis]